MLVSTVAPRSKGIRSGSLWLRARFNRSREFIGALLSIAFQGKPTLPVLLPVGEFRPFIEAPTAPRWLVDPGVHTSSHARRVPRDQRRMP